MGGLDLWERVGHGEAELGLKLLGEQGHGWELALIVTSTGRPLSLSRLEYNRLGAQFFGDLFRKDFVEMLKRFLVADCAGVRQFLSYLR